ncbi:hypothetical protein ILUMI_23548 [Ignelater luminosus]|uniref:Uncharacterized protein n=1 Tax=Ignelater luminosus TaxID=2038154 RepID=A0A8K0CEE1_IGNLU|nr:hypothetical protein ILUMI_23548 [Ignelater luminosus]
MHSEHVVGDSDRGSRKRQRNTTSKERKKEIRQKLDNIKFPEVNLVHEIKHKKVVSLHKLLVQLTTENWREDPKLQWLLAVFPPDINNHEDANSQTENDDEDVYEHVCECNENDGGIKS